MTKDEIESIVLAVMAGLPPIQVQAQQAAQGMQPVLLMGMGPDGKPRPVLIDPQNHNGLLVSNRGLDVAVNGSQFFSGSVDPGSLNAANGDLYLNTSTGNLFQYESGSWSVIMNLVGPGGTGVYSSINYAGGSVNLSTGPTPSGALVHYIGPGGDTVTLPAAPSNKDWYEINNHSGSNLSIAASGGKDIESVTPRTMASPGYTRLVYFTAQSTWVMVDQTNVT